MTPEQQRIAIAKACGWELISIPQNPAQKTWQKHGCTGILPDYLNDLNAMAEAEIMTSGGYSDILRIVVARDADVYVPHLCDDYLVKASVKQRAEALLRHLSLWQD